MPTSSAPDKPYISQRTVSIDQLMRSFITNTLSVCLSCLINEGDASLSSENGATKPAAYSSKSSA